MEAALALRSRRPQRPDLAPAVRLAGRAGAVRLLRRAAVLARRDARRGDAVLRAALVATGLRGLSLRNGHERPPSPSEAGTRSGLPCQRARGPRPARDRGSASSRAPGRVCAARASACRVPPETSVNPLRSNSVALGQVRNGERRARARRPSNMSASVSCLAVLEPRRSHDRGADSAEFQTWSAAATDEQDGATDALDRDPRVGVRRRRYRLRLRASTSRERPSRPGAYAATPWTSAGIRRGRRAAPARRRARRRPRDVGHARPGVKPAERPREVLEPDRPELPGSPGAPKYASCRTG